MLVTLNSFILPLRCLLKETYKFLSKYLYLETVKKASEIRQDNMLSTEAIPAGGFGYQRKLNQSHTNSKALRMFQTPITPDLESKRSSTYFSSLGEDM